MVADRWSRSLMLVALATMGCGSAASEKTAAETPWIYGPYSNAAAPGYDQAPDLRRACQFKANSFTSESVGTNSVPDLGPIEHVVLVLLENRSFDHYFSTLENPNLLSSDIAHGETNPDDDGTLVPRFHETRYCVASPDHEWDAAHLQYDAGQMDGFVAASSPHGERAMGFYTSNELPLYQYLGRTFAISARHFASLLGPTEPNRLFYYTGTSCNFADDIGIDPSIASCAPTHTTMFGLMDAGHVSYKVYDESNLATLLNPLLLHAGLPLSLGDFVDDAQNGHLADVSIVGASTGAGLAPPSDDDHPPANPQNGQAFLYKVINALGSGPLWGSSALIVTFDEHGGFYDHVPPPRACDPDPKTRTDYAFDQLGFRVPLMVISAWSNPGYVSHYDTDHTSILRFLEHWKHLPALTRRDANAWPLLDLFQFDHALPPPVLDTSWMAASSASQQSCAEFPAATGLPPTP